MVIIFNRNVKNPLNYTTVRSFTNLNGKIEKVEIDTPITHTNVLSFLAWKIHFNKKRFEINLPFLFSKENATPYETH
jgi:hypothetical protein